MNADLKARLAELITRPRPIKPQTERQLTQHLSEHHANLRTFLLSAAEALDDHELDVLFSPQFTPSMQDQAAVADLLYHRPPSAEEVEQLVRELTAELSHGRIRLPDGSEVELALHEVMVERFVRLLRLPEAPAAATAASLREALPAELWPVALALVRQRGFTPQKQRWFAGFVDHLAGRRTIGPGLLTTLAEFIASQPSLEPEALADAADALVRASKESASYTASGHAYWSPDVAQHHQYRGQGTVDQQRAQQRQQEAEWAELIAQELRGFDGGKTERRRDDQTQ